MKSYKGRRITTVYIKNLKMYEARVWYKDEGHYWFFKTMPCLFDTKDKALEGAQGWIDEWEKEHEKL